LRWTGWRIPIVVIVGHAQSILLVEFILSSGNDKIETVKIDCIYCEANSHIKCLGVKNMILQVITNV